MMTDPESSLSGIHDHDYTLMPGRDHNNIVLPLGDGDAQSQGRSLFQDMIGESEFFDDQKTKFVFQREGAFSPSAFPFFGIGPGARSTRHRKRKRS